jgi:hypothetical protein
VKPDEQEEHAELAAPVEYLPEGQAIQTPLDEKVPGPQDIQSDCELWFEVSFPNVPVPAGQTVQDKLPMLEE